MIYIISGASRSGKSIAAKKLMKTIQVPYCPVDSLMMGFMKGIPEFGIHDKLWPNEIAERIWPFLKAAIESMIFNQMDYIFEGEAFLPEYVHQLSQSFDGVIQCCFMGYAESDLETKVAHTKNHPNHDQDWLLQETETVIHEHLRNMIEYSAFIQKECTKYSLRYLDTTEDFEGSLKSLIQYFTKEQNFE
jgi:hypothetical protein